MRSRQIKQKKECDASIAILNEDVVDFALEEGAYALIVAHNVLPFLSSKEKLFVVVEKIIKGLAPGGFAVITLFGPRDAWKDKANMTFIEYDDALAFFATHNISLYFKSTEEGYGPMMNGTIKF